MADKKDKRQSVKKAHRRSETKRKRNAFVHKSTRSYIRSLKKLISEVTQLDSTDNQYSTKKEEINKYLPKVHSMIDKLAKRNIIHSNKAANIKSKLSKSVAKL